MGMASAAESDPNSDPQIVTRWSSWKSLLTVSVRKSGNGWRGLPYCDHLQTTSLKQARLSCVPGLDTTVRKLEGEHLEKRRERAQREDVLEAEITLRPTARNLE